MKETKFNIQDEYFRPGPFERDKYATATYNVYDYLMAIDPFSRNVSNGGI